MGNHLKERMQSANADLLQPGEQKPVVDQRDGAEREIASMQSQLAALMPDGGNARQIVADAIQLFRANPKLRQCDPVTVLGGLVTMAQLNLRPGVGGMGWLIPMNVWKRGMVAQLIIGYQGYLELARRSPALGDVQVIDICEHDDLRFSYDYDRLEHRVDWQNPGRLLGWYTVVKLTNGTVTVNRPWTVQQMEDHRDRFAMAKKRDGSVVGPWRDNFEAMARKTMILQALKYAPKSFDLQQGLYADSGVRSNTEMGSDVFAAVEHPELEQQPVEGVIQDGEAVADQPGQPG
ncbi:recombinase RecT [Brevibacterium moorei]|uniref:recombinase RecT n=1 Tax=Brevibacterium moorei TaxID=2968457 RepID=UPI00211CF7AA|nr:recombinase RecT [Brevibacterium sp. 68QC2CO]MCQ9384384.1 recombinase RecT [Brevibacterium sp. 68QC2CO]